MESTAIRPLPRRWLARSLALLPVVAQALRTSTMRPCERERFESTRMELSATPMAKMWTDAGLDAVYVAHYTPYTERKVYMEQMLARYGLQAQFITGWDREVLNDEDVECMYPSNAFFEKVAKKRKFAVSWLTVGELGLSMKHASAYFDAMKRGHRNILVLEDDAVFATGFASELQKILKDIGGDPSSVTGRRSSGEHLSDYDILFLGSYFPNRKRDLERPPEVRFDIGNKGAIGYLVSLKGAKAMMNNLPITGPADHMISNGGSYPNPPRLRYSRIPYLIWQGTLDGHWRNTVRPKDTTNKGRSFIVTNDTHPCDGCACPSRRSKKVSRHVVSGFAVDGDEPSDSVASDSLYRSAGRELEGLQLDKESVDDLINAGRACSFEDAVQLQKSLYEEQQQQVAALFGE